MFARVRLGHLHRVVHLHQRIESVAGFTGPTADGTLSPSPDPANAGTVTGEDEPVGGRRNPARTVMVRRLAPRLLDVESRERH